MYTFVFLWTPALSPNDEDIPHGFIFATFMLASMLGSSIAARLLARNAVKVESYMQIVFVISSASLLLPILTNVCSSFCLVFFLILLGGVGPHLTSYCFVTVLYTSFSGERGWHLICRLSPTSWLLRFWSLCWDFLAIHYENEIPIHPWGSSKHHHEFLPHPTKHLCLHCAIQCMSSGSLLYYMHGFLHEQLLPSLRISVFMYWVIARF